MANERLLAHAADQQRYRESAAGRRRIHEYERSQAAKERHKRWRESNRKKKAAHSAVAYALQIGTLVKPKRCDKCRKKVVLEAHHGDYDKPLKVDWLCKQDHEREHHGQ